MCVKKWLKFNWIVCDTEEYLEPFNFDLCQIELTEIEQFDHFTVCINKMCLQIIFNIR